MLHPTIANIAALGIIATAGAPQLVQAQGVETSVLVRVLSHDAKLIGTAVGGAQVTIRNVATGEVLASGTTAGGTGDTELIIRTPHERRAAFFDTEGAAGFRADFSLTRPTIVEVSAVGPLDYPEARASASKVLLLEPGGDIDGNGIVLELHGLIVEVVDMAVSTMDKGVTVRARVRMLCSCPTGPEALWTVERIVARLMDGDEIVAEVPLDFSGETSVYTGTVPLSQPGSFVLIVVAADTDGGNAGMGSMAFSVR
jgi:hypothetical protein